jgi:hypothetical protein
MKLYFALGLIALTAVAIGIIYLTGQSAGKATVENKVLKTEIKEVRHEAQSFADRPRSRDDRVDRLCRWAVIAGKNEGKPLEQLPAESCPRGQ